MVDSLVNIAKDGKSYLENQLRKEDYFVNDSSGNFVFIETKNDADKIVKELKNRNILVKCYHLEDGKAYLRVTIGAREIMEKFLHEFFAIDK